MKGFILIDPKKCMACKSCELECALVHAKTQDLKVAIKERPLSKPRLKVEQAVELAIPLQCRHCEDAPCAKICPSKAIEREGQEDPVLINNELCIGCKWCILVCPFGVIRMDEQGKAMIKCDLCIIRLEKGEKPACVMACPTGALQFKSEGEFKDYLVKFKKGEQII